MISCQSITLCFKYNAYIPGIWMHTIQQILVHNSYRRSWLLAVVHCNTIWNTCKQPRPIMPDLFWRDACMQSHWRFGCIILLSTIIKLLSLQNCIFNTEYITIVYTIIAWSTARHIAWFGTKGSLLWNSRLGLQVITNDEHVFWKRMAYSRLQNTIYNTQRIQDVHLPICKT